MKDIIIGVCILLTLAGCSTYKSYQKVAADPVVDSREIILLEQKCRTVFPEKISPPVLSGSGVDSSDYLEVVTAYNELLDVLIKIYESDTLAVAGICPPLDSVRIIKRFLRSFRPPAIVRTDTVRTQVTSIEASATIERQRIEISTLRSENYSALENKDRAEKKLQKKNASMGWILGGGLLLAVIAFFSGRILNYKS